MSQTQKFGFTKEELLNGGMHPKRGLGDFKETFYNCDNVGTWFWCDSGMGLKIDECYSTIYADVVKCFQFDVGRGVQQGVVSFCAHGISSFLYGSDLSDDDKKKGIYVNLPRFCAIAYRWYVESAKDARGDAEVLRERDRLLNECIRKGE